MAEPFTLQPCGIKGGRNGEPKYAPMSREDKTLAKYTLVLYSWLSAHLIHTNYPVLSITHLNTLLTNPTSQSHP